LKTAIVGEESFELGKENGKLLLEQF